MLGVLILKLSDTVPGYFFKKVTLTRAFTDRKKISR